MLHLSAFYESVDSASALVNIAAVHDQVAFVSGDDLRAPKFAPNIVGAAALSAQTAPTRAQISSPSLRTLAPRDIRPIVNAVLFGSLPEIDLHSQHPWSLAPDEPINFLIRATGGAAAANYGLVWFADGVIAPAAGDIFRVHATSAITLSAGVWVNGAIAFTTILPAGTYHVVGLAAFGTNLVAARLMFAGTQARPGVPAVNAYGDYGAQDFCYGRMGVFGEFNHVTPPSIDCLGVTDSSQSYIFDLIKVG